MPKTYSTSPDNGATWTAKRHAPATYANNTSPPSDEDLATIGQYPEVYPDPVTCSAPCCSPSTDPTLVDGQAVYIAVNLNDEDCAEKQREQYRQQIDGQVPQVTENQIIADPLVEADTFRAQAAATDKLVELEDTADADLDAFDPTIDVADPQDDTVAYSRFTANIITLDPWAGAPDAVYGWECTLEVRSGSEGDGSEGRVLIIDDPSSDSGGVLSFVQDAENPAIWTFTSRDGGKWEDPAAVCKIQLLWGAGSLPTSPTVTVEGRGDRTGVPVRYGVASGGGSP